MSADLTSRDFALLLDEFVRGELDADRARACERHLASRPPARADMREATRLLLSPAWRAAGTPPDGLLESACAATRQRIVEAGQPRARRVPALRPWRPALAWAAAAAAVVTVVLLSWPAAAPLAFADVLARLRDVDGVRVEGWVLGPQGRPEPWRQWVAADGSFVAEIGADGNRRSITWRAGVRMVRDAEGRLYRLDDPRGGLMRRDDVQQLLLRLEAMARSGGDAGNPAGIVARDLGASMRYERQRNGPLGGPERLRWTLDVDKATSLPRAAATDELVDGAWVRTSELGFVAFTAPEAGAFPAPDGPAPAPGDDDRARLWFELEVSPRSLETPAVTAPAGDSEVRFLGAADAGGATTSGGYSYREAGVTTIGLYKLQLDNLVRGLSGLPVVANEAAQRRVSIEVRTKSALPWRRQLATALDSLDLRAETIARTMTRRRFEFGLDGRPIAPSRHELGSESVRADVDGYRYDLRHMPLEAAITTLMGNSGLRQDPRDTTVFAVTGGDGSEAMRTCVDVAFHNPDGSWETNLAFLRERFGVTLAVVEEELTGLEVELVELATVGGERDGE